MTEGTAYPRKRRIDHVAPAARVPHLHLCARMPSAVEVTLWSRTEDCRRSHATLRAMQL